MPGCPLPPGRSSRELKPAKTEISTRVPRRTGQPALAAPLPYPPMKTLLPQPYAGAPRYLAGLALLTLLAACGGGEEGTAATTAPPAALTAAAPDTQAATATMATEANLATAQDSSTATTDGTKKALAAPGATAGTVVYSALTVRAYGTLAGNVGPLMQVRKDGTVLGTVEVRSTTPGNYTFWVPNLQAGSKVDVVFTNDAVINGQDRNLYVLYLKRGSTTQLPVGPLAMIDRGAGALAFDGLDTLPGGPVLAWAGALRLTWPATAGTSFTTAQMSAARLLNQASFGPTTATINRVAQVGAAAWVAEQMAIPHSPDFVNHLNSKFAQGVDFRPGGAKYDSTWVTQRFWATAATSTGQLRKRVAWALHQMLMVSQTDSNLFSHTRAYAQYLDTLNKHAFGNYRQLLEEVALSPAMGIYLSHIRNQKEDAATHRQPDENFARELMQLFTIGLHELNSDGTPRLGADGKPIETYDTDDVMALAKVFTGYSWGLPDNQLTDANFKWGNPDYKAAVDTQLDLNPMKAYAVQHSAAAKNLFAGTPNATFIPAYTPAATSLRMALDALFKHPNMGPFVGRQLIQRLVTSSPSPGYVARVAAAFNNNGIGVRGDMAAVVRAVLLDAEARTDNPSNSGFGRLKEPVQRMTHWMRAMDTRSSSGQYMVVYDLDGVGQRALYSPSVFSYYRPGYVPPQTVFASRGATAPEFQIVNESTTAAWVNRAYAMSASGVGWNGSTADVSSTYTSLAALAAQGDANGVVQQLNLLLFAGTMSSSLQQALIEGMAGVLGTDAASHLNRARMAVFVALASPEFVVQR